MAIVQNKGNAFEPVDQHWHGDADHVHGSGGDGVPGADEEDLIIADGATEPRSLAERFAAIEVTPEDFGAKNDGSTVDDVAFDAAIASIRANPYGGTLKLKRGTGYRLDLSHDIHPSVPLCIDWEKGSRLLCGLKGAASVFLKATHPTTPESRPVGTLVLHSPTIEFHASVTASEVGAVFFENRYAAELKITGEGKLMHYRHNTAIRLSSCWNCDIHGLSIWGAGYNRMRKVTATTFAIAAGATTLVAAASVFTAADIGRRINLFENNIDGQQQFTITAVGSGTSATVSPTSSFGFTVANATFDGVKVATTASSTSITVETASALTSDIGRVVYVIDGENEYGNATYAFRSTIAARPSTTVFTLATAPPVTRAATYIIYSPAVEIYDEVYWDVTNDIVIRDLHIEQNAGTGIVVQGGWNVFLENLKVHGYVTNFTDSASTFAVVLSGVVGAIIDSAEIEGTFNNDLGVIHTSGIKSQVTITKGMGTLPLDQRLVYRGDFLNSGRVTLGDWTLQNHAFTSRALDNITGGYGRGQIIRRGSVTSVDASWAAPYPPGVHVLGASAVAVPHTGDLAFFTYMTVAVPPGSMGLNGRVRITANWSHTNNANNKYFLVDFGGSVPMDTNASNWPTTRYQLEVANRNSAGSQIGTHGGSYGSGWGAGAASFATFAVDTRGGIAIALKGVLSNAADTLTLESYLVELIVP